MVPDSEAQGPEVHVPVEEGVEECEVQTEAQRPNALRDPGTPTAQEVAEHCVTHMPYRSWCPSCVAGKARDRGHYRQPDSSAKQVPEIVFDYCFLGTEGEEGTQPVQVARDRRSHMLFAHLVPSKGLTHEHGARAMASDIDGLGHKEVILKSDGEPALKSIQEEVRLRQDHFTIVKLLNRCEF